MSIHTLLIANRGEIACRIIRTAKQLKIKTIAIYTDIEKYALHCQMADEAYCLGSLPLQNTYLNIEKIIQIAKQAQANAIHPGYGFLSENAGFAKACEDHNIIFIGPSAQSISWMASKDAAKARMLEAELPIIPGYLGEQQDEATFFQQAQTIGYPILLKAAKGGGGKGMRLVQRPEALQEAIQSAKRESLSSFGDDTLIIEKYLPQARHLEIQIIRDYFGNTLHLFERDCSLQRRHQKIIEYSPALNVSEKTKQALYDCAIRAAQVIDYHNAGTVEFLYCNDTFYFMEMNTRLQVEHPVTEMTTGIDLVAWQILIANKKPLPLKQNEIKQNGFSIEARIYAEDPYHSFFPATGKINKIIYPPPDPHLRIDTGVTDQSDIQIYFDPMIAKVIVQGPSFEHAVHAMQKALNQYHLMGLINNLPFLKNILDHPLFLAGEGHTQFIEIYLEQLIPLPLDVNPESIALACLIVLLTRQSNTRMESPWQQTDSWRLNLPPTEILELYFGEQKIKINITHLKEKNAFYLNCDKYKLNHTIQGDFSKSPDNVTYRFSNDQKTIPYYIDIKMLCFVLSNQDYTFHLSKDDHFQTESQAVKHLCAPMPGLITRVWVDIGDSISKGEKLITLEAMKMEHTLLAPQNGIVKVLHYPQGAQVQEGNELIEIEFETI